MTVSSARPGLAPAPCSTPASRLSLPVAFLLLLTFLLIAPGARAQTLSALTLAKGVITPTYSVQATVTLTAPAPAGGASVALSSSNTAAATVPPSAPVAAGATTATFTITTLPVTAQTTSTIQASYGGVSKFQTLTLNTVVLTILAFSPTSVVGGKSTTGKATFSGTVPAGGLTVSLSSDNASAVVPATAQAAAGTNYAGFTVTTTAVSAAVTATVTATYAGAVQKRALPINPPAPAAPTALSATPGNGLVTLAWAAPAGTVTSYNVKRGTVSGAYTTISTAGAVTTLGYTDGTAVNGTPYYYVVSAVNGTGEGPNSLPASATPTASGPTVVTPASANPNPVTATTTALSVLGADAGGEANLTYTWATTGTPPATPTYSANGTNAAKNTTATFTKSGSYGFVVTIQNATGLTISSNVTVVVNQTLTTLSLTPSPVTLPAGAIQAFTPAGLDQFSTAMTSLPALTWSVPTGGGTISPGGVYTAPALAGPATVQAAAGSITAVASVTVITPPPTPTNLIASPSTSQIGLVWTASAGATSYNLYRGTVSGGEAVTPLQTGLLGTSALDAAVSGGPTYYYQVTAVAGGESGRSNEASSSLVPGLSLVNAPPNSTPVFLSDLLLGTTQAPGTIQLGWTPPPNLQSPSYNWSRYTDATHTTTVAMGGTSGLTANDVFQFVPGTTYYYGVKASGQTVLPDPTGGSASLSLGETVDLGEITALPIQTAAADNQTADSRQDTRNTPVTNLDYKFASKTYRGGLYTGYVSPTTPDSSRVGRSFTKFLLPPLPTGQALWANVGNLFLYYTQPFDANALSIQANPITSNWAGAPLTWDGAPSLALVNGAEQPTVPGANNSWMRWHKYTDILAGMQAAPLFSYGLISTNEASDGWAYFAKKEYDPALAPCLLYGTGGYSVAPTTFGIALNPGAGPVGTLNGNTIAWNNATGLVTLMETTGPHPVQAIALPGGLSLSLTLSGPVVFPGGGQTLPVTIPAGQFCAFFTVTPGYQPPTPVPPATVPAHGSQPFSITVSGSGLTPVTQQYTERW